MQSRPSSQRGAPRFGLTRGGRSPRNYVRCHRIPSSPMPSHGLPWCLSLSMICKALPFSCGLSQLAFCSVSVLASACVGATEARYSQLICAGHPDSAPAGPTGTAKHHATHTEQMPGWGIYRLAMPVAIALGCRDELVDLGFRQMLPVRNSALGRRRGVTVRFTVPSVTSFMLALLHIFKLP